MRILVSGATADVRALAARWSQTLGVLLTPASGNRVGCAHDWHLPWAADNAAFSNFDASAYRRMLTRIAGHSGCLFLTVPDRVGDARRTLDLFHGWREEVAATGLPVALVGQDGAEDMDLPWDDFAAFFVGGSTRWKLSQAAADLCREAKAREKHVHMGRVNTLRRLRAAIQKGCDSIDGTSMSRYGRTYIERFCRYVAAVQRQESLLMSLSGG